MNSEHDELCTINLQTFINKSKKLSFKIVGTIKTIFKHKKYILEVYLSKKIVIRCFKRYNQYEALYSLIQMKHKNYNLGQFPSKFQILNKQQTRKEYFQFLLNKIVQDHSEKDHNDRIVDSNRRLLSILYLFLTSSQKNTQQNKVNSENSPLRLDKDKTRLVPAEEEDEYDEESELKERKTEQVQKIKPAFEQKFFHEAKTEKKHRLSYEQPRESDFNFFQRRRRNSLQNEFLSQFGDKKKININQFQFKFENQGSWKNRYLVINQSGMFLYKDKLDNYFRTRVQLFRIKVQFQIRRKNFVDHFCEKMEFNNLTRTFNQNPNVLTIFHEHDYQKIQIRKPMQKGEDPKYGYEVLSELKKKIKEASQKSPVVPEFDGVFNPIGKLFIFLHKVEFNWKKIAEDQTIFLRIKTAAVLYDTRPLIYSKQINIQQGFLIPVNSTFETISIECLTVKDEGWVKDNAMVPKVMGKFTFTMAQLLSNPEGYILQKININLQTKQSKVEKYETTINASIQNFSDYSSIYSDSFSSQNDGKILPQIKGLQNFDSLIITIDRVQRVVGNIALFIQSFWRNVYHFKYPRMGYTFFSMLAIIAVLLEVNEIFSVFIFLSLFAIVYHQKHVKTIVNEFMNKYYFSKIHPKFKYPQILNTSSIKYLKWSNHISYITKQFEMIDGKMQRIPEKKMTVFEFQVHGKKFQMKEENQNFFQKMKEAKKVIELLHRMMNGIVNSIQKIANLLSWHDPKRTMCIICILIVLLGIASGWLIRIIVTLFCIHKLVKGKQFYSLKHYPMNRKFAVYGIRYILHKNFPEMFTNKKNQELSLMTQKDLDKFLSDLVFPIHDESHQNILKIEMQEIMGIHLDPQQCYKKAFKKNYLKVGFIIDMIQTCESKLKLKEISGFEGRTSEFQELRQKTKQILEIDIWVEYLLTNFILNIPSQLYVAFASNNLKKYKKQKEMKN